MVWHDGIVFIMDVCFGLYCNFVEKPFWEIVVIGIHHELNNA